MMWKSCMLFALMLLLTIHSSLSMTKCKKHELEALLKFKHSFSEDPMRVLSSWVGEDCCHWRGVSCDNVTGDVVKLNLRHPESVRSLWVGEDPIRYLYEDYTTSLVSSELSSALLELNFLSHLDLSGNNFNGSRIPEFVGSMTKLRYLNLSGAVFSGPIPPQIGNLTNLIHLDLSDVGIWERYMVYTEERLEWASGLSKLQSLDMSFIDMSQAYDSLQVLFRLPSLLVLSLSSCSLNNTHLSGLLNTNTSTLQHLDLSRNQLNGSLPSQLGQLTNLNYLDLFGNEFHGPVPISLANLSALEHLDLSNNEFSGLIPDVLGHLAELEYLDISSNSIQDTISHIGNLSKLSTLKMNFNNIKLNMSTNWRPPFQLQVLHAQSCEMNNEFPQWLRNQTQITDLDLSYTGISGELPQWLGNLTALGHLDLSYNKLSGLNPDVLGHLTELEYLDISSNSIHGTVSHFGNLSKLSTLNMNFNNIKLNMSTNWRPPFQLQVLGANSCGINMAFPQWLRNQTQIESLDLSYTGISGELPQWVWNFTNLYDLQVAGNKLTGSLPRHITCDGCKLDILDLHNNKLSGIIPPWLKHLKRIFLLDLSENLLSGRIFETQNGSSLLSGRIFLLDLSDNMLSGEIQVKKVYTGSFIEFLSLRGNDFSGHISSQLCNFPHLKILELAQNSLTGHIPRCLGSIIFESGGGYESSTGMETQEIIKGTTQNFHGTINTHSMIDLSCNLLVGTIPEELANITNLMQLNLSNNRLTGGIPDNIGNLQQLESLDLSNNNLSGTIPQSLSDIPWLSDLNLSYNHLHGSIPTGHQLQTLTDPSIYTGNSGLCGFPLPNKCTDSNPPPSPTDDDHGAEEDDDAGDKHDKLWLYLAVMYGVAAGFWGVVGTLVLKKSWRHAYFRFVEKTADRIYVPIKVRMNRFKTENSG